MNRINTSRSWIQHGVWGTAVLLVGLLLSSCIAASPGGNHKTVAANEYKAAITSQSSTGPFISKWEILDSDKTLALPLVEEGNYNFLVHWGDGSSDTITSWNDGEATHTYTAAGEYIVTIIGVFEGWRFVKNPAVPNPNYGDAQKLLDISQWGSMALGAVDSHFAGASNLVEFSASDAPDLSSTTSLKNTFRGATKFNGDLSNWNVSSVRNMSYMFFSAYSFNQDIGDWNVSAVTDMSAMFEEASTFNQDIGDWNVSAVRNMHSMFEDASAFNQDIGDWKVSAVEDMNYMFWNARAFNQDIGKWNVSAVEDMSGMFLSASSFNQDISSWDVARVKAYEDIFLNCPIEEAYKPQFKIESISKWKTDNPGASSDTQITLPLVEEGNYDFRVHWGDGSSDTITSWNANAATHTYAMAGEYTLSITGVFEGWRFVKNPAATTPDYGDAPKLLDISQWGSMKLGNTIDSHFAGAKNLKGFTATDAPDLKGKTSLKNAFYGASSFNGDISNWNVSTITTMEGMFARATTFNSPLRWGKAVQQVTNMSAMFEDASTFNQDIGDWKVSSVRNMHSMFEDASAFNQDIGDWKVSAVEDMSWMFGSAESFNQDIGDWNVSAVKDMSYMFSSADSFNQDISNWDVVQVKAYEDTFLNCPIEEAYKPQFNRVFISKWKTDNPGASSNTQITLPLVEEGNYYFHVHWGDGSSDTITSWNANAATHTYASAGEYTLSITGVFEGWRFLKDPAAANPNYGDAPKLLDISQWRGMALGAVDSHFAGASNLVEFSASDAPDLSKTTSLKSTFEGASKFNGDINNWNVSSVRNMSYMFFRADSFNQYIEDWNVSAVENMQGMFYDARAFNQLSGEWNVSSVRNMSWMFAGASAFNQDIGDWKVSAVKDMSYMFSSAESFNQDIGDWNVSEVEDMSGMFLSASSFNQDISSWDVDQVEQYADIFLNCPIEEAHKPQFEIEFISKWKTDNPGASSNTQITLPLVEEGNYYFHVHWGDGSSDTITSWNANAATHTYAMAGEYTLRITGVLFEGWRFVKNPAATTPDYGDALKLLDISQWGSMALGAVDSHFAGVSNLVEFSASDAPDLSSTTSLKNTFRGATKFNGDLSNWNVSAVTDMSAMFEDASSFNQNISGWNVSRVKEHDDMFLNCPIEEAHKPQFNNRAFISKWKTDNPGASSNRQITLPLVREGNYNFTVDWGDGSSDTITSWNAREATHTYSSAGEYTVSITGTFEGWRFMVDPDAPTSFGDAPKLLDISQWGIMALGAVDFHFAGASNLVGSASDAPDLSRTTSLRNTFSFAHKFNGDISAWDVSSIENMRFMFYEAHAFNQDINTKGDSWNVSAVEDMNSMFFKAYSFNGNISDWNVSSVKNMRNMFGGAIAFNRPIGDWNVSSVEDMSWMFSDAYSFNQDISSWNVDQVEQYEGIFTGCPIEEAHKPQFKKESISKWKTDNPGASSNRQITLPLVAEGNYDFRVD